MRNSPEPNNILLFARDPGGANTIIPLIDPLRQKNYNVLIYGKDVALVKFKANGVKAKDIVSEIGGITAGNIKKFLKVLRPHFVITGTSADDLTEKFLWKSAEELNIPSFAIIDQWINYGIRFSSFGVSDIERYQKERKHQYLPTKILVMDKLAKDEAIREGLPEDRVVVSGQPYFEYLMHKKFSPIRLNKIKKEYKIGRNDYVIVFASEPLRKTYGGGTNSSTDYWGYDEIAIFKYLFQSVLQTSKKTQKNIQLIIKLHPKEDMDHYARLISLLKQDSITVHIDKESDPQEMIKIADMVCGISSMFLLESYLLEKPTVSIQIGLKRENPFILHRIGLVKSILTQGDLNQKVLSIVNREENKAVGFKLIQNPIERVIDNMEKILCQN